MKKATFYHAGCPVCVEAERTVAQAIDRTQYELEIVHFSQQPNRIAEAEGVGVQSVPALVLDEQVFHINFGASLADVKGAG
ncbi:MAG: thioredoxin family protein [Nitrospirales bacterium]|nr:thioredoxin family protein [Nitrospirales bacterium]